jgi:hypothetical protein
VIRHGQTSNEKQRFLCRNEGGGKTFIQEYSDKGRLPEIKQRIVDTDVPAGKSTNLFINRQIAMVTLCM